MLNDLLIMALATATISVTIGQSKLFAPFRAWAKSKWQFVGELLSCPYCLGHWVAVIMVMEFSYHRGVYSYGITQAEWFGLITWWLAITGLSALISGAIGRLYGD